MGGLGHQIYRTGDFKLPDETKSVVLLPDGHLFSDFECIEVVLYSGASITVEIIKVSDASVAVGIFDYRTSSKSYRVDKSVAVDQNAATISPGGDTYDVKAPSLYSIVHAFGVLK